GFVHFVASDSYGCSRSSDSTQVDAYAIPTAETTSPSGETYDQVTGNSEDRFQAGFIQTLSDAASDSFSTLVGQEQSGGDPNLLDLCHFTGSAFDPYDLSGVQWTVRGDNTFETDWIGLFYSAVVYYMNKGRT